MANELARFLSKVKSSPTGCLEWQSYKNPRGYGKFRIGGRLGKSVLAYRFSYESSIGPVPDGKELDHLCRNPSCVNPFHLEPVSHHENMLRGGNAIKDKCPYGHSYSGTNAYVRPNGLSRVCRECGRLQQRARRAARAN